MKVAGGERDLEPGSRVEGPPEEAVGDHEGGRRREGVQSSVEFRLHELRGGGEGIEEGHGRDSVGALDTGEDVGQKCDVDDGGCSARERGGGDRAVGRGGDDSDGGGGRDHCYDQEI